MTFYVSYDNMILKYYDYATKKEIRRNLEMIFWKDTSNRYKKQNLTPKSLMHVNILCFFDATNKRFEIPICNSPIM